MLGVFPPYLSAGNDSVDVTIRGEWLPPEFRVSLRLIGFEENYSRFVELKDGLLLGQPWPTFGITGALGYFGAGASSRPVSLVIRFAQFP